MNNLSLFLISTLIWGSTWLVIKFQLGRVSPIVSVGWRFALAALMLLAYSLLRRRPLRFGVRDHAWIALQGVLLFGLNYMGIYLAEQYLTSGLVAVVFSLVVFLNAVGMRIFFGWPIRPTAVVAAVLGTSGVALIFARELPGLSSASGELRGLVLATSATVLASLGNMVATRNQRRQWPVLQVNAWSMLYGAGFVLLTAIVSGARLDFELTWAYVSSLIYLSLLGSALAFGAYLTLMQRIGADRAVYTTVTIPIVALLLSTVFEHMQWHLETFTGVAACVGGTALALGRRTR